MKWVTANYFRKRTSSVKMCNIVGLIFGQKSTTLKRAEELYYPQISSEIYNFFSLGKIII